jgi:hypothetical protein
MVKLVPRHSPRTGQAYAGELVSVSKNEMPFASIVKEPVDTFSTWLETTKRTRRTA